MAKKNEGFEFKIVRQIGVLSESTTSGWTKEVNLVEWNGSGNAKIDIRDWSPDHTHMGRGITLTDGEAAMLRDMLETIDTVEGA